MKTAAGLGKNLRATFLKNLQYRAKHMTKYDSTFILELSGESKARNNSIFQFS